jgi:hypothetical protein
MPCWRAARIRWLIGPGQCSKRPSSRVVVVECPAKLVQRVVHPLPAVGFHPEERCRHRKDSLMPCCDPLPRTSFGPARPRMAKVDPNKVAEDKRAYGALLRRAVEIAGLTDTDAADKLELHRATLSKWFVGTENPQMWRWHAVPVLRKAFREAEAEAAEREGLVRRRHVVEW